MGNVDMHLHTAYSDGTDDLPHLISKLRTAGISTFSITDHDTIEGSVRLPELLPPDMTFIRGVELSCATEAGKCHILGYGYDPGNDMLLSLLKKGSQLRREKLEKRLEHLRDTHGIVFSDDVVRELRGMDSVGKPHLAKEIIKMGLADSIDGAIRKYINGCRTGSDRVPAGEAISAIKAAGGVAVWAHPLGGEGEKHLPREDFTRQLRILRGYGIAGLECWYSRYDKDEIQWLLEQAESCSLAVSGGSDYHGSVKNISLGELNCCGLTVDSDRLSILKLLL